MHFNSKGNLYRTINLTFEAFNSHFLKSPKRLQLFDSAIQFFRLLHDSRCKEVYIAGSFSTQKDKPEDIDLCVDLTDIDNEKLTSNFPNYFAYREIGRIRKDLKCHLFFFDKDNKALFNVLKEDRDGNQKGMIILDLEDILLHHDQK